MADPKKILGGLGKMGKRLMAADVPNVQYADPLKPPSMRMSEALGNAGAEGKTLNFTEADRSRVFGKNRGGVGFAGLQHYSLPHKQANTVWGFGNTGMAEKKIRQNDPENSLWTTFVGSPQQHKSNSVVIGDAIKEFQKSVKQGVVPREQIMLMNKRLNEITDDKTGAKIFEEGFDLTDPSALNVANTFARRAAVGDVMLGLGVKGPMVRLEFKKEFPNTKFVDASNIENILKRETDPDLVNAGTYDVGNRLFVMDGKIIQRPDLNEAFPVQVTGTDLGMKYELVPPDKAMRDFYKAREGRKNKHGNPSLVSYYDLARAEPSQLVDEDYLTFLQKEGYAEGGEVGADQELKAMIADHLDSQAHDQELRSMVEGYMAGGEVGMADGGKVVKGAVKGFKRLFAEPTTESKVIQPPSIIIPSKVSNVKEAVRQSKGEYGARRVERAADEIPNLEKLYKEQALREAFLGDNAKALMSMSPADFEKYAKILQERSSSSIGPKASELAKQGDISKGTVPTEEYIQHLRSVQDGFNDVPFLVINKEEQGLPLMPFISGHEGRHRSRAMAESGEPSSLVQLFPRSELREPFPRRSQEEYIEALKRELEMTDNMVLPEGFERPPLKLPDIYADGGVAMAKGGKMVKGLKRLFSDPAESSMASTGKRKFEDGAGGLNIIKETGGNWLTGGAGSVERALKPLKRDEFIDVPQLQDPATTALNKWVDSNLTNYVKKQMATKDDPVRKLAEEGVIHIPTNEVGVNRYRAGKVREAQGQPQLGKSDAAKAWEDSTDTLIYPAPAGEYTKPLTAQEIRQGKKSVVDENPWLEKVAPKTSINAAGSGIGKDLGFDHIMDVLRADIAAGRIRPEQLNKVSMEQAVRRTYEFDQEMAKKMRDAQIKVTEGMPVHKDYADKGYKWIELSQPKDLPKGWTQEPSGAYISPTGERTIVNPSRKSLDDALKYEGETMGHCVGSYCDDVAGGKSRIFSLRDAKGEPHVTVEVKPKKELPRWNQIPDDIAEQLKAEGKIIGDKKSDAAGYSMYGDERDIEVRTAIARLKDDWAYSNPIVTQSISQIKGKQNAAPKEEYLPFVQDFVRSGEWSSVGDLSNTALIPANAIKAAGHDMTGYDQKYFTNQEYVDFLSKKHEDFLSKNFKPSTEGMAEGGGAFKTLRFDNGGIASPDENLTYESKPSRFSKVASEMYDETKQSLANDYERLKNSGRARAQLAKIAALQMAGGAPDLAHLGINFVVDPLKDAIFTKPRPRSVLEGPPKAGEKRERVPMFGSIGEALTTKDGLPMGGSEHLIKRAQEAGLMYGKNIPIYDSEGNLAIDPETNEPYESRSGRFSLPTEIGGAILGGGALSKMRKVAGKGYQKFAEPRVDPAGALSRAIKADSNAMFNQNLRAR